MSPPPPSPWRTTKPITWPGSRHGSSASSHRPTSIARTRLFISLGALTVTFGVAFGFQGTLIDWLNRPLDGRRPITLGVAEPFTATLTISLYAAFVLSIPILLWQLWSFLAPALDERSQKTVARLVQVATVLLVGGMAFAYWVVLPAALHFLLNYNAGSYRIVRLGVVTSAKLRRNRKIGMAIVIALAVALPGVDPVTTALESIPLMVLFEGSIWAAANLEKRWAAQAARSTGFGAAPAGSGGAA